MNWQKEYESLIRFIGSVTYGKERWFYKGNGIWYDREENEYINMDKLAEEIIYAFKEEE